MSTFILFPCFLVIDHDNLKRFIEIDKLSTAVSTSGNTPRPYRFGYGVLDANLNLQKDADESKVYFEFSDYSTSYIFYEKPENKG